MNRAADAVIIGGGPAGSAMALLLARAGRRVDLLEKSAAPEHKVCGEFLSPEAVQYLRALGIDAVVLGAAPLSRLRLASRWPIAEQPLPFAALSLTRRALDEALLALCQRSGVNVLRGRRVESLEPSSGGWIAQLGDGASRSAPTAFLATGKHDLHGWPRPAGKQNDLVAFKMYFRMAPAQRRKMEGFVDLILFPGGYAGMQQVEEETANLCLLVQRAALKRRYGSWPKLMRGICEFSPYLAERLLGAEPLLDRPLALSSIPYGYLRRGAGDNLWRLGDQAAVIPSFSGDGASIALHSAHVAAETYLGNRGAAEYHRRLHTELRRPLEFSTTLSRLMIAAPSLAPAIGLRPGILNLFARRTRVPGSALLAGAAAGFSAAPEMQ